MSTAASPEPLPSPPVPGPRYSERSAEDDPEYLRARNMAADLRQDFNMMEQKKRVTMILQSPSFREELESLIQEQMKKGNNSSHIWALRQIADFMATTSPAALPTSPMGTVSAMRCGVLPISRAALLLGDVAYFDFHGEVEDEADRVELQKSLGPTCKILVLRNHGVLALGDTAEEAFYSIFHLQAACEIQVSALASAGGVENLIVLERAKHRPHEVGSVRWAGSTFGPMQKSRLGEHEFEALMRMLDNLGYRTGYTYRYPFVQEKSKPKSDVLIPATVTAFVFEEEAAPVPALRQHAQKQQKEKTRWLNTPNTYMRVNVAEEQQGSAGSQKTKTTWLKADEVEKGSSGTPIRIENPNQFVPLYTDPQEVLEMRNKIREQNRQDVKSAGPQSQLLASVIAETSRSPSTESRLGDAEAKEASREEAPPEPEPPNPFSQLTDQELEEYKQEVERKKLGLQGEKDAAAEESQAPPAKSPPTSPPQSPATAPAESPAPTPAEPSEGDKKADGGQAPADSTAEKEPPAVVNGKDEEQSTEESLGKGGSQTTSPANADPDAPKEKETVTSSPVSPEGSPSKSPSKKKKKFRTPSFLKKGKKKEKIES
ncbi:PREDICTED: beta-adducin [Nipponia nippon]|uniref:beta-adducin n=1 Tax=Nipponia nippon TaxID=128390 RepID=UPI0005119C1B|nr:PREDICTED: beta-adducin [Nipponia nippon]